ncbi:VOC family protein [Microvirga rosea]|uniref:VOC family protein n=1 Tax=Microvirga rosea TaxID=2715425 RepID=UPI001D0AD14F|nr:VOC family protein [Microvirga rosea]MCB8819788.1 VOC family protein [Microvirga rosea]
MQVKGIDHFVLVVKNIDTTCAFYSRVLGMTAHEMHPGRWALHFGSQKINLQQVGLSVDPFNRHPTPGAADFCLLTDLPMETVMAHLRACGIAIIDGPVRRTGATGPLLSVYFYDPDDNLVEVSNHLQE